MNFKSFHVFTNTEKSNFEGKMVTSLLNSRMSLKLAKKNPYCRKQAYKGNYRTYYNYTDNQELYTKGVKIKTPDSTIFFAE